MLSRKREIPVSYTHLVESKQKAAGEEIQRLTGVLPYPGQKEAQEKHIELVQKQNEMKRQLEQAEKAVQTAEVELSLIHI